MNLFRLSEPETTAAANLQFWRERILQILLYLMLGLGSLMYIANLPPLVRAGQWSVIAFFSIAYLSVLGVTIARRLPYSLRAGSLLVIAYLLGPVSLLVYGLSGDGRVWLLFFMVFAGILFGIRTGLMAVLLAGITYVGMGYLMTAGFVPVPPSEIQPRTGDPNAWLTTGLVLFFIAAVIVVSIAVLVQSLENTLKGLRGTLDSERELSKAVEQERNRLEERSTDLERRLVQIRTAADISRTIVEVLDPQELMRRVVGLVQERFELYYVGVFLLGEKGRHAHLAAGSGEAGELMLAEGHKLTVGGPSMVGWATARRQARIALDVGQEAIRFSNPHLPLTRSELALPLLRGEQVLGALTVQSSEPEAFDQDDIIVLQSIADSLAGALENARLFQQFETSLSEIQHLNRQYLSGAWAEVVEAEKNLSFTFERGQTEGEGGAAASLDIPLTLRGEQVIGSITVEAERAGWSPEEMEFIEAISTQAAMALESARLLEETQRRVEQEQALSQLTARLARTLDFDTLLQTVVRELGQLPKVTEVSIHMAPPEQEGASNGSQQPA